MANFSHSRQLDCVAKLMVGTPRCGVRNSSHQWPDPGRRSAASLGEKLTIEGWLDRLERVRFWCAFKIIRPADETLIAECRQMLAIIQMPEAKLLRVPEDWDRYRIDAA